MALQNDEFWADLEELWERIAPIGKSGVDIDVVLDKIALAMADLGERRKQSTERLPDASVAHRVRLVGALLYDGAQEINEYLNPGFEAFDDPERETARELLRKLVFLRRTAQALPWPEFGLRAIGAIRGAALGYSKSDTELGYTNAWSAHQRAADKLQAHVDEINSGLFADSDYLPQLKQDVIEIEKQIQLSETGTSCRQAEFILNKWDEHVEEELFDADDDVDEMARLALRLQVGITSGSRALQLVNDFVESHGLAPKKTLYNLLTYSSLQNPGIMTARAYLLLIPMCPILEADGRRPPVPEDISWERYHDQLLSNFYTSYAQIERHPAKSEQSFISRHTRSIAQIRLNFGVLFPGAELPTVLNPADGPWQSVVSTENVEQLAEWLADREFDGNIIGTANMIAYLDGVQAIRDRHGENLESYREWRLRWFSMDRHRKDPGRKERMVRILG